MYLSREWNLKLPDSVRRVNELAGGKDITVFTPEGSGFKVVPKFDEPPKQPEPSEAQICLAMLQREQARDRETVEHIAKSVAAQTQVFQEYTLALNAVAENQRALIESINELVKMQKMPVKAIFKNGKAVGAERVEKL